MSFIIDGVDFENLEAEKYWSFTSSYTPERKKREAINMVYSGDYLGARKMDGAYYRAIISEDGELRLQGRSKSVKGGYLNKIDWVPHLKSFFEALPRGTCLLGEVYFPKNEGSYNTTTIMGCLAPKAVARQETGEKLHYYIFDIWAYDGESYLNKTAEERFTMIQNLPKSDYVEFAQYYEGVELWQKYQEILAEGGEGVVITRRDSKPQPGKRSARKTLKLKKELQETLDVFIYGGNPPTRLYSGKEIENWQYWQNTVTHELMCGDHYKEYFEGDTIEPVTKMYYMRGAGSLKIGAYKDGKPVQIGSLSGLDDEILLNWKDYIGKVVEITAMEVMRETQGLRHPKFVSWRLDKVPRDCQWETIFG